MIILEKENNTPLPEVGTTKEVDTKGNLKIPAKKSTKGKSQTTEEKTKAKDKERRETQKRDEEKTRRKHEARLRNNRKYTQN